MSTKEPWNNEIYEAMRGDSEKLNRKSRKQEDHDKRPLTTRFLTFLVVLMFIIVLGALGFILWNNQVSKQTGISSGFAQVSTSESTAASSSSSTAASTQESSTAATTASSALTSSSEAAQSSSTAASGSTYTIQDGDTPSKIASKTGVDWATIASLNNISSSGYNADGSAIYPGQVLKLK